METNGTSPTTTPTITTIITTTITTTTIQEQTTIKNFDTDTTTTLEETTSTTTNSSGISDIENNGSRAGSKKGPNWLIIAVIVLVIFCILATLCIIAVIFRRRKQSGKQDFGYMNGQRSKKKKGAEDDVWAGPVKLGGGDCAGPEEGDVKGEQKKLDEAEMTALSTFTTVEENGGVGRPGSPEVGKWEEQEPLLFIDEEGKEKRKEEGKSDDADAKEGAGRTEEKEAEPSGGESFCLTTAV
ncbi:uncharacterized protein si:ch73-248e21.7 [Neoarius graeffei]|uniref:uncharacterized protein si:ch73-248e21.7 n=1 Tax=Neoarius graeffei TaxID=443677 RepID=UPI00298D555F|nr:uncharacterized protein si:ch73-248e21.7 [Neoarius graeffei]